MSKRKDRVDPRVPPSRRSTRRAGKRFWWGIAAILILAVAITGGWLAFRGGEAPPSGVRLPGPAGGRDIAQDVNTLVGQRAPSFSLSTADGQTNAITPGRGRPTVLIFHMGIG